jgi:hypothetical protein
LCNKPLRDSIPVLGLFDTVEAEPRDHRWREDAPDGRRPGFLVENPQPRRALNKFKWSNSVFLPPLEVARHSHDKRADESPVGLLGAAGIEDNPAAAMSAIEKRTAVGRFMFNSFLRAHYRKKAERNYADNRPDITQASTAG